MISTCSCSTPTASGRIGSSRSPSGSRVAAASRCCSSWTRSDLSSLRLPGSSRADFICSGASASELEVRARRLLGEDDPFAGDECVSVDGMTINLATYQVSLDGEPVDLTLMEYSLLSFLVTHPNRAYSREVLLHRVWGFEYCGGTRTVDVHIRRIRSKVGPQIAAHISTVRGVGYLFKE